MSAVSPISGLALPHSTQASPILSSPGLVPGAGFGDMLRQGLQSMESKISHADEMVRRFALDEDVPIHQVTFALEEARLSVELAMQVRTRLVESYRELMNMQL